MLCVSLINEYYSDIRCPSLQSPALTKKATVTTLKSTVILIKVIAADLLRRVNRNILLIPTKLKLTHQQHNPTKSHQMPRLILHQKPPL